MFRLNVIEVRVPSLRDRPEDILPLAQRFVQFFAKATGRRAPTLSPAAETVLLEYAWPGNVRELRNVIERALILWPADVLEPHSFRERIFGARGRGPTVGDKYTLEEIERAHVNRVVAQSRTMEDAAAALGIGDSTLWRKRKRYQEQDLEPESSKV